MSHPRSVCIFCGSRTGTKPAFAATATALGTALAKAGIRMVFGGGHVGMMGLAADAALAAGGEVVGVIPEHLIARELGHEAVTKMHIVDSMHARKELMFQLSDAFVVLPGGVGTLDETFEIITWKQLGMHDKPIVILDAAGYWTALRELIDHITASGFADPATAELFTVVDAVDAVIPALEALPAATISADPARL